LKKGASLRLVAEDQHKTAKELLDRMAAMLVGLAKRHQKR